MAKRFTLVLVFLGFAVVFVAVGVLGAPFIAGLMHADNAAVLRIPFWLVGAAFLLGSAYQVFAILRDLAVNASRK